MGISDNQARLAEYSAKFDSVSGRIETSEPELVFLNLGCGYSKRVGAINVDKYANCEPDVVHDLNVFPYPWDDDSVDGIVMFHVLEHLGDWWTVILECARILKPGGKLHIRVPDESSTAALTYRDHNHVFSVFSFHGISNYAGFGTNAWAEIENEKVPLMLVQYQREPFGQYKWMQRWGFMWLLEFCATHFRNFIHEQRFDFIKIGDDDERTRLPGAESGVHRAAR